MKELHTPNINTLGVISPCIKELPIPDINTWIKQLER